LRFGDQQEIQYPPILRKLLAIGTSGFVNHECIPTRDPREGLQQAVRLCDA
jgi:hydroxypyruvate isomerase